MPNLADPVVQVLAELVVLARVSAPADRRAWAVVVECRRRRDHWFWSRWHNWFAGGLQKGAIHPGSGDDPTRRRRRY